MLHQIGVSFDLFCDARKHKIKIWNEIIPRKNGSMQFTVSVQLREFVTLNYLGQSKGEIWTALENLKPKNNLNFI